MKYFLAGSLLAVSLLSVVPASAQGLQIGPDGPSIDLRSRRQRERDMDREVERREMRREQRRRDQDDDDDRPRRRY